MRRLAVACLFATTPAWAQADLSTCSFPSGFSVANVASSDPYGGVWVGSWDGRLTHTLIVDQVNGATAHGYYVVDDYAPWGVDAGCWEFDGEISEGSLVINFGTAVVVTYNQDGEDLTASWWSSNTGGTPGALTRQ